MNFSSRAQRVVVAATLGLSTALVSAGSASSAPAAPPPGNVAPVAVPNAYFQPAGEDLVVSAPGALANDFDADGDSFTWVVIDTPDHSNFQAISASGGFTLLANPTYAGPDSFTYQLTDQWGQLSNITTVYINWTNSTPIAVDDHYEVDQNQTLTASGANGLLANDSDPDPGSSLEVTGITGVTHTQVLNIGQSGSVFYKPTPSFVGTDSFQYHIADEFGVAATGTVTIEVKSTAPPPGTHAPHSGDDSYVVVAGTTETFDLLTNDIEIDGDAWVVDYVNFPQVNGTWSATPIGLFTIQPHADFVGTITGSYQTKDDTNAISNVATITVEVVPPPDADPGAVDPDPVDPDPVYQDPVDPEPVDAEPVDPDAADPDPVDPDPANPGRAAPASATLDPETQATLPVTGPTASWWIAALGLAVLAAGVSLVRVSRSFVSGRPRRTS